MHIAIIAALLCAAAAPARSPVDEVRVESHAPRKKKGKPSMDGVLNVNRATEAELRLLPGIGKKRAQLIVERRDKKPFANLDELGRMKGMRNLVKKLRVHLAVQGDTTLHPAGP